MDDEKYICWECVEERYVSRVIKRKGINQTSCSYCGIKRKTIKLEELAGMFHNMFIENYEQPEDGPDYDNNGDPAEFIIQEVLEIDEIPAADLFSILQDNYNDYQGLETIYDECFRYLRVKRADDTIDWAWENMEESLKKQARYFNKDVKVFLDELFSDIENMKTAESKRAINEIGEKEIFYRARAFENYEDVEKALEHPEKFFGPPPHELARSGRMNAHGVPVFYGATSVEIAVAEVRPVVGNYVVVVAFKPLRPLLILDISALSKLKPRKGSIFDKGLASHNSKAAFMRTLSRKLTMPVSGKKPEDEYLITQVVSEYLALSGKFRLDGISFNSTQRPANNLNDELGQNVVLFNNSSKVINSEVNESSYVVNFFENVEDDEFIFNPVIRPIDNQRKNKKWISGFGIESHIPTLELMPEHIFFKEITGVSYEWKKTKIEVGAPIISDKFKDQKDKDF